MIGTQVIVASDIFACGWSIWVIYAKPNILPREENQLKKLSLVTITNKTNLDVVSD